VKGTCLQLFVVSNIYINRVKMHCHGK